MGDEQKVRQLLALAAGLPDDVESPTERLLERAHRRRTRRRVTAAALTTAVVVAAAVTAPVLASDLGAGRAKTAVAGARPDIFPPAPAAGNVPGPQPGPGGTAPEPGPTGAPLPSPGFTPLLSGFRWSTLVSSPLGPRPQPVLAWAGDELVELAGGTGAGWRDTAAAYRPASGTWHLIAPPPRMIGTSGALSVWTGSQSFVTNSSVPAHTAHGDGVSSGLYDPATNRWVLTRLPAAMQGTSELQVTWTGRAVVVAGVRSGQVEVAALTPGTGQWTVFSPKLPARHPARFIEMVASPGRLIVWSFWDRVRGFSSGFSDHAGIDVLALGRSGAWRDVTGHWPQNQDIPSVAYTDHGILIPPGQTWCGTACSPPAGIGQQGAFADPGSLARTPIPAGPLGPAGPAFVWTGQSVLAVDLDATVGAGPHSITTGDMAAYDPATGHWHTLPSPPGHPGLPAVPVWAGAQLLELTSAGHLLAFHG